MQLAHPSSGNLQHWEAEAYPELWHAAPVLSAGRIRVLCLGLLLTALALAAAWVTLGPATVVQTRIVADSTDAAGRAALADLALRVGTAPERSVMLVNNGEALVIAVRDGNPASAWRRARSMADTMLDASRSASPIAAPERRTASAGVEGRTARMAERNRLLASVDGIDARAASLSAALTGIARDIAAGARSTAERKGGRETLDKGTAALADLQLQRIQLLTRYQDDYPAVAAIDGQIRSLRSFLQDEARRVDAASHAPATDSGDLTLLAERDRLRAEATQLNDRRTAIGVQLDTLDRSLAADQPAAGPPPETGAVNPTAPVLLEASTVISRGPDSRWLALPAIAGAGLLVSVLAWFKPRRQAVALPVDLLLQRLEAAMARRPALPQGMPALTRDEAVLLAATVQPVRAWR